MQPISGDDDLPGCFLPGHADHAQTMPGTCVHLAIYGDVHISDAIRALSRQSRNDPKTVVANLIPGRHSRGLFDNLLRARSQIHDSTSYPERR